jgi:hypothetical protein
MQELASPCRIRAGSKQGNALLRFLLIEATQAAMSQALPAGAGLF